MEKDISSDNCPFCLEKLGHNSLVLSCGHVFHSKCAVQFLTSGKSTLFSSSMSDSSDEPWDSLVVYPHTITTLLQRRKNAHVVDLSSYQKRSLMLAKFQKHGRANNSALLDHPHRFNSVHLAQRRKG